MDDRLKHALLDTIEDFFASQPDEAPPGHPVPPPALPADRELQLATAALMVCVVRADRSSRQDEHRVLEKAMAATLGVDRGTAARIVRLAEEKLGEQTPFRSFLELLNRECSDEQKKRVVEALWRVAFADAELKGHEEYVVRKAAEHLNLSMADLVEAKVRAKETFLREDL